MNNIEGRYWGIWCVKGGGFIRDGDGRFYYYPHPAIAQAQADEWNRQRGDKVYSVKEFVYKEGQEVAA